MALYRALDPQLRKQTREAVAKLSRDPNTKGLHLKPLKQGNYWSIRVNDNFRVLLKLIEEESQGPYFEVAEVGNHDIYRQ